MSAIISSGNFQKIELAGDYDVQVRTGSPVSVTAQGPENVLNRLRIEVDGDKLLIGPKEDHGWFHFSHLGGQSVRVQVTVPTLSEATLAGSGTIDVDKVQGDEFAGTIAGSGDLRVANVAVRSLKVEIAGSGSATAANGNAESANYDVAGSGSLDAAAVRTRNLKVSIAGSGGVRANASQSADVDIMGSGDVDIAGGAKCTVSKSGSGSVRCS